MWRSIDSTCRTAVRNVSTTPKYKSVTKLLIANRGEIACRIMKTAKLMGVGTVAVFSEADSKSMHVALADEAYNIGAPPSHESYLRQDKILSIAKATGSDAIHPGYGFLSENAEFAEKCQDGGFTFVGPPARSILDMGIKSASKRIMVEAGVPVIQGYHGDDQAAGTLLKEARSIGFPVMLKAVRGGGGKGMRVCLKEDDFNDALESAKNEALKSFGDSDMLVEKFVSQPRHIEVQVFCDTHGNAVYLFERDCSVQRRHQKIIEEAPAPGITEEMRSRIGLAAVKAAQAVGYVGAGTVEFIVDSSHNFFFMEMNTRLQVEHPVTEMVTGVDLVEWQLRIAAGERLPLTQEQLGSPRGHSFEARIYAEDPDNGFLPDAGVLAHMSSPAPVDGMVRIETGVAEGDEVSTYYDPMISKLVVWGHDRPAALQKLRQCLSEYSIVGVRSNIGFLHRLASHPQFESGNVNTDFISNYGDALLPKKQRCPRDTVHQAAMAVVLRDSTVSPPTGDPDSPFWTVRNFRVNSSLERPVSLATEDGRTVEVLVTCLPGDRFQVCQSDGSDASTYAAELTRVTRSEHRLEISTSAGKRRVKVVFQQNAVHVFDGADHRTLTVPPPVYMASKLDTGPGAAVAPMAGTVERVYVADGQAVLADDPLVMMIAMKMEHTIRAPRDGVIQRVLYQAGDLVQRNDPLVRYLDE